MGAYYQVRIQRSSPVAPRWRWSVRIGNSTDGGRAFTKRGAQRAAKRAVDYLVALDEAVPDQEADR